MNNQLKKNIYDYDNLWKLSLKVILPALIISLQFGIYIFIDQILMQQLIPTNGKNFLYENYLSNVFSISDLQSILDKIYSQNNTFTFEQKLNQANEDAIFLSISTIGTINLIFISIGFFVNTGFSILYSRALAKKDKAETTKIWVCSFYSCLLISVIVFVIILSTQQQIIKSVIPSSMSLSSGYNDVLIDEYYKIYTKAILEFCNHYTFFITASIPFLIFTNLFIFLLRAEGKNNILIVFSFVCNFLNIGIDVINFNLFKLNIVGGGIASFTSYVMNTFFLIIYIFLLDRKKEINFSFFELNRPKIYFNYLFVSFFLSLGTFLRDLSIAIANIIYIPLISFAYQKIINANGMPPSLLSDIFAISVTPMYNLFFFAIFGIVDGLRPILAYNYELKRFKEIKKIYYNGMIIGLIFAFFSIIFSFSILNETVFNFFNANTIQRQDIYKIMLATMMCQLPFVAISISGMSIFQANGKIAMTIFLSIFQGLISFVPTMLLFSFIAISTNNYLWMIVAGFINIAISSILIETFSEIYLHKYMGKKEKHSTSIETINWIWNKHKKTT